jgi:Ser/Thr protein kinase RdoA (MazF antagonist)
VYDALLKFPSVPYGDVVLRHGDLWPGNMLWQDGRLTGIIDWEETLRGPAMGDVAICRLDVFWVFGREAMEAFTAYYLEARPVSTSGLEFWDLRVALRPMQNFAEWVGPYASLDRPDMTTEGMRNVLLEFIEMGLSRVR